MRTREEIENDAVRCDKCGGFCNPYGECICSYKPKSIPVIIELLLDIRDLLTKDKQP